MRFRRIEIVFGEPRFGFFECGFKGGFRCRVFSVGNGTVAERLAGVQFLQREAFTLGSDEAVDGVMKMALNAADVAGARGEARMLPRGCGSAAWADAMASSM